MRQVVHESSSTSTVHEYHHRRRPNPFSYCISFVRPSHRNCVTVRTNRFPLFPFIYLLSFFWRVSRCCNCLFLSRPSFFFFTVLFHTRIRKIHNLHVDVEFIAFCLGLVSNKRGSFRYFAWHILVHFSYFSLFNSFSTHVLWNYVIYFCTCFFLFSNISKYDLRMFYWCTNVIFLSCVTLFVL